MPKHHVMKESRSFRAIMKRTEEEQRRQRSTSPFVGTGVSPNGSQGIDSDNYVAGVSGFSLNGGTGVAEFDDIILRDLPNSMLASPVVPDQAFAGTGSFTLSVAGANIITIDKAVPTGFTKCVVNAFGRLAAINSTGSADALYSAVDVNGSGGNQFGMPVAAGSFGSLSAGYSTLLTGLTAGGNIAAHLYGSTGSAGWASNPANGADLSVTYLWFR